MVAVNPKSVTLPLAGTTAVIIGSELADGKMPSARSMIGLGAVWTILGFASDAQPSVAVPFAWLVFMGSLLVKGEKLSSAIDNPKAIDLSNLKPFQTFAAGANVGATVGTGGTVTDVPSGNLVGPPDLSGGTKNMVKGGIGGNWAGAGPVAEAIALASGLPVSSRKRTTKNTASGNTSDHYVGMTNAYAVDLAVTGAAGDAALAKIMRVLGHPEYKGGSWFNTRYGNYRVQVGWKVPGHYDHIHVGVRRV